MVLDQFLLQDVKTFVCRETPCVAVLTTRHHVKAELRLTVK